MRLFYALVPDIETRHRIVETQLAIDADGRKVSADKLHMTLVFLGEVDAERLSLLTGITNRPDLPEIELVLDRIGTYRSANVLWLGSQEVPLSLIKFRQELFDQLTHGGLPSDSRPWQPHVTLYRNLRTRPRTLPTVEIRWRPEDYRLVQSEITDAGLHYRILESC